MIEFIVWGENEAKWRKILTKNNLQYRNSSDQIYNRKL